MKTLILKKVLTALLALFVLFYVTAAVFTALRDQPDLSAVEAPTTPLEIAIFGASGTAGDGILKAALASADIAKIHVITRRSTARIEAGVTTGKVAMTKHMDYLDYSSMIEQLAHVDAVYWAIGISSLGMDEKTYGMIHVDFPMQFVTQWGNVSKQPKATFHYISSSDISEDSGAMWVREKIRAENSLFKFADEKPLRVIAYRPDYIGPTREEAHLGQNMVYWFFKPVGAAVRARQIGQAMIEASVRGTAFEDGADKVKLSTADIHLYSDAYERRHNKQ